MSEEALPSEIYLDTSTVTAAVVPGTTNSRASAEFCERLVAQRSRVYFSQLVRLQYIEAIKRLATKSNELPAVVRQRFRLDDWEHNLLVRRRWLASGVAQFEAFIGRFVEVFDFSLSRQLWLDSVTVMAENRLRSYDALHVATARDAGLVHFAAADRHFRRVDDLAVWLTLDPP